VILLGAAKCEGGENRFGDETLGVVTGGTT
jgi:hypothetical protein